MAPKNVYKNIWPKSCRLMEHTHLLRPHQNFQVHSIHMCRENEFLVRRLLNWTPGRTETMCTSCTRAIFSNIVRGAQPRGLYWKILLECSGARCHYSSTATGLYWIMCPCRAARARALAGYNALYCTALHCTALHCTSHAMRAAG